MKTYSILSLLLGIAATVAASSLLAEPTTPSTETVPEVSPAEPEPSLIISDQAKQLDAMTLRFLAELLKSEATESNPSLSPLALATALEALELGADGNTAKELAALLGSTKESEGTPADEQASIWAWSSAHPKGADWKLNHALWYHQNHPLRPSYLKTLQQQTALTIAAVDFGKPEAVAMLSDWAVKHSDGKLKQPVALGKINDLTRLVWISLLNYQGKWHQRFDASKNTMETFHAPNGEIKVTMMNGRKDLTFVRQPDYGTVAVIPMEGGNTVMEIRLPDQAMTRAEMATWLLQSAPDMKSAETLTVPVVFPKAEIKSTISWLPVLEKLGAQDLLVDADFSKATEEGGLSLTELATETSIRFDESGAEVASSAAAVVGARGVTQTEKKLRLDRPFVWIIRESQGGMPLACGLMESPSAAQTPVSSQSASDSPAR